MHHIKQHAFQRPGKSRLAAVVVAISAALGAMSGAQADDRRHDGKHDNGHHHGKYGKSGWKNPLKSPYTKGPLDICDQGVFYVGGVAKITPYADSNDIGVPQQNVVGQMYVQFQTPKKRRKWPLIMVHGGGYSGSSVESTPHGTEGWDSYAVRRNLATFVVDQVGRGRSGFDNSILEEVRETNNGSLIPDLRLTSGDDLWTNWLGHLIPEGSSVLDGLLIKHGDPRDPECATDPAHCTYRPRIAFKAIDPRLEAGVGRIGPTPNPANATQLALQMYKFGGQIYGERFLPTSVCEECTPTTVPPDRTWSGQALAELVAGLGGAVVATHSQSGAVGHHMVRYLKEKGQLHKLKGLITIEGGCSLADAGLALDGSDFDRIPYLAFKGDYQAFSEVCQETVNTIRARRAAGLGHARADYIQLDDPSYGGRFNGTTHMMMQGTNNLEVFDEILRWSNAHIRNPIARHSCRDKDDDGHGHHGHHGKGRWGDK
jgi:hypothetical protein